MSSVSNRRTRPSSRKVVIKRNTTRGPSSTSLGLNSKRVRGPVEPPPTKSDIQVQQVFPFHFTLAPGTNTIDVTPELLALQLPSCVDRFRIHKVSVWRSRPMSTANLSEVPFSDSSVTLQITADLSNFEDQGTFGSSRACLHVMPCLQLRQQWYDVNANDVLFAIGTDPIQATDVVNFYAQLLLDIRTPSRTSHD